MEIKGQWQGRFIQPTEARSGDGSGTRPSCHAHTDGFDGIFEAFFLLQLLAIAFYLFDVCNASHGGN
jgi:hypothetical protein